MSARVFPEAVPDISTIATALADRSRAAMCAALMDGRVCSHNPPNDSMRSPA